MSTQTTCIIDHHYNNDFSGLLCFSTQMWIFSRDIVTTIYLLCFISCRGRMNILSSFNCVDLTFFCMTTFAAWSCISFVPFYVLWLHKHTSIFSSVKWFMIITIMTSVEVVLMTKFDLIQFSSFNLQFPPFGLELAKLFCALFRWRNTQWFFLVVVKITSISGTFAFWNKVGFNLQSHKTNIRQYYLQVLFIWFHHM